MGASLYEPINVYKPLAAGHRHRRWTIRISYCKPESGCRFRSRPGMTVVRLSNRQTGSHDLVSGSAHV